MPDPEKIAERVKEEKNTETAVKKREAARELSYLYGEQSALNRKQSEGEARGTTETAVIIAKLEARDGEVRAHEAAHVASGGAYVTGGASYTYQNGPDGKRYAIGGEVGINSAPIPGNPEATIVKMRVVRAAALAPAEPSGADLSVAGAATQGEAQARMEIAAKRQEELKQRYTKSESASGTAGFEAFA